MAELPTVTPSLAHLRDLGLIRLTATEPDEEYIFKHALTQEAVYNALLIEDRKRLHQAVAETLESLFAARLNERAGTLAQHFFEAGDLEKAHHYFLRAGDHDFEQYANAEAVEHYQQAIELAQASNPATLIHLHRQCGRALELLGQFGEAIDIYQALYQLGETQGNKEMVTQALLGQGVILVIPSPFQDLEKGRQMAEIGLTLSREHGWPALEAKALWILSLSHRDVTGSAKIDDSIRFGEAAIALARELDLKEQLAYALNDIQQSYLAAGRVEDAWQAAQEAESLWQALGNMPMLIDNLASQAQNYYRANKIEGSLQLTKKTIALAKQYQNYWNLSYALVIKSQCELEFGRVDQAIAALQQAVDLGQIYDWTPTMLFAQANLGIIRAEFGQLEQGLAILKDVQTILEKNTYFAMVDYLALLPRLLQVSHGQPDKATLRRWLKELSTTEADVRPDNFINHYRTQALLEFKLEDYTAALNSLEILQQSPQFAIQPVFKTRIWLLEASIQFGKGDFQACQRILEKAQSLAESVKDRRRLWQILGLQVACQHADPAQSVDPDLQKATVNSLTELASNITEPELRAAFLNQPSVQTILQYTDQKLSLAVD